MEFQSGYTYHVYNQGNNKEAIFFERENYLFFLKKMKSQLTVHAEILAWCLMPNHFHWLIRVNNNYLNDSVLPNKNKKINPLNRAIGTLQSSYTQAINKKYDRTGSLFRTRTKAKSLSENEKTADNYGINCFLYIHQNPLRAGLVKQIGEWEFSSFRDYAGVRDGTLCNKELACDLFDLPKAIEDFKIMSQRTIPNQIIKKLF